METGRHGQEPNYPNWIVESSESWEEDADRLNAVTFEANHEKSWSEI